VTAYYRVDGILIFGGTGLCRERPGDAGFVSARCLPMQPDHLLHLQASSSSPYKRHTLNWPLKHAGLGWQ
jgi:hypothetical protein